MIIMRFLCIVVFSCLILVSADRFFNQQSCEKLKPVIQSPPQNSPNPFQISVRKTGEDSAIITLRTAADRQETFVDFFIQAREVGNDNRAVGEFENDGVERISCLGGPKNSVHKANSQPVKMAEVQWDSDDFQGRAYFLATVVHNENTYWTNMRSQSVEFMSRKHRHDGGHNHDGDHNHDHDDDESSAGSLTPYTLLVAAAICLLRL